MDAQQVEELVKAVLPDCEVQVAGEGNAYQLVVVDAQFEGMRQVKRQQTVYAGLNGAIADGSIHAVTIRAFSPDEAQALI
ncbi:MAG: hypothetical protein CR978_01815 [Gammaproteobacteria bacterium]|nr:MAG: hypothetical protein CR978_01815 [Gammaproteobacteria bacterium]PIE39266.1 MAG: hypothetical protein CSA53_02375 [Gammaproteobacteria bacterium]